MKKIITFICIGLFFISCSKDDNSSSGPALSDTPLAKATYDSSSYGIYKGIFVGSTGNVLININNNGTVSATIVIDGITYNFTTTESVTENQNISMLTFTSGTMSFDFSVTANGSNPLINNINISSHPNAAITVVKEDSEHLVRCYQGTYVGDSSGTFNLVSIENEVSGLATIANDGQGGYIYSIGLEGEITNNQIDGYYEGGTFTGTVNGNNINGTWANIDSENGTWSGTRTL